MKWAIGIDPGFGETGLVLQRESSRFELEVVAWATYGCPKKGTPDLTRAVSLAGCVVNTLVDWVDTYDIEELDIAIELPVYNGNAQTLITQIRLLEEIESGIFHIVAGEVSECWLTEVNPATSKSLAGCGPKEKPTEQSPFERDEISQHTHETLADAWAHGLATWGVGGTRFALHELQAAVIKHVSAGPGDGKQYWEGICQHIKDEGS